MSNFETWWEREGQEFLYALNTTTDDDIKLVAEFAWKNGAYKAEQPISQEPVAVVEITYGREPECYVTGNVEDLPEGVFKLYTAPQPVSQEPEVWYCPDCGTLSETQVKCCPDWIRSRKVPKNFALICRGTFNRLVDYTAPQPVNEQK